MSEQMGWETAITKIEPNKIQLRGYPIDELMGAVSYGATVYLAIKGELPSPGIARLMDIMLVSSVDHGATPPSTLACRTVASTGAPLNNCIAAGILSINKFHGGAIENCMLFIMEVVRRSTENGKTIAETAEQMVQEKRAERSIIHGFGHRVHTRDPRTIKLLSAVEEANLSGPYMEALLAVQESITVVLGKQLPINVDGALAGILCELDFPAELANAFFIMARIPGLVAHIHEERTTMRPMRKIDPTNHHYVGPEDRHVND